MALNLVLAAAAKGVREMYSASRSEPQPVEFQMPSEPDAPQSFQIGWGREPDLAETISAMLLAIDDPAYISHAELQYGIADNLGRWADHRAARTRQYVASMLSASPENAEERRVATIMIDATIVGFALVEITRTNPASPFATLHDVVFSPSVQGRGLGNALFDWLAEQCRAEGVQRFFLESGVDNHRAHAFFKRQGFLQTSIVMMRDL
jgi:ribosomal protein S18 acetylase RimI-like enzyme